MRKVESDERKRSGSERDVEQGEPEQLQGSEQQQLQVPAEQQLQGKVFVQLEQSEEVRQREKLIAADYGTNKENRLEVSFKSVFLNRNSFRRIVVILGLIAK